MPLKCMRSQVCTPLQIVAGCCCWLLLLLAAAGCCCGCCCWLLLLLLLLAAAAAAAGCGLCWLLLLLLAAAAAAGCCCCGCCCWLLQLIAGICRNKENANYRNGPLLIQGIYDLRATCARLARDLRENLAIFRILSTMRMMMMMMMMMMNHHCVTCASLALYLRGPMFDLRGRSCNTILPLKLQAAVQLI